MSLASVIRSEEKLLLPTYDRHKILFRTRSRRVSLGFPRESVSRFL